MNRAEEAGRCPPLFVCPAFCTRTGSGVYNGSEKGAWGVCFGEAADAGYWASVRWRWGPGSALIAAIFPVGALMFLVAVLLIACGCACCRR